MPIVDEKTAQSYFSRAEKEIDETFFPEGEEAAHVTEQVHMKPSYVKGLVKADWTLDQYNAVDVDGTIILFLSSILRSENSIYAPSSNNRIQTTAASIIFFLLTLPPLHMYCHYFLCQYNRPTISCKACCHKQCPCHISI